MTNPDWPKMSRAKVLANGDVTWSIAGQFRTRCSVNMRMFPFDTQKCMLEVGLISQPVTYLNTAAVGKTSFDRAIYGESEEFKLLANSTETSLSGNFSSAVFQIILLRRSGYYVLNIILPCCLLAFLSLVTFCLPVNSGERVSLQITVLLSQSVYQLILTNYVPVTSINIPVLSEYHLERMPMLMQRHVNVCLTNLRHLAMLVL